MEVPGKYDLIIHMFGTFRLKVDGRDVPREAWRSKKSQRLFRYLLTHRGRRVKKETLLELLWPGESLDVANKRLHTAVYFARRMLQPDLAAYRGLSYIRHAHGMYWFELDDTCWLDVDVFERTIREADPLMKQDPAAALARYTEAIALYEGEFLCEEPYEDWAIGIRERYAELFATASLRAAQLLVELENNVTEALDVLCRALEIDPYREEIHQARITFLIQAGRYAEAGAQYRQLVRMLDEEFGLEPSPDTQGLLERLREPGAPTPPMPGGALREVESPGPLLCSREAFDAIHELALRMHARHGEPTAVITVRASADRDGTTIGRLGDLLRPRLRQSDVLCLDGSCILIQLLHTNMTGCKIVKNRIKRIIADEAFRGITATVRVFEHPGKVLTA